MSKPLTATQFQAKFAWIEDLKDRLKQMEITSNMLQRPDRPISLRYVYNATNPVMGIYQVLDSHRVIFEGSLYACLGVYVDPNMAIETFEKRNVKDVVV